MDNSRNHITEDKLKTLGCAFGNIRKVRLEERSTKIDENWVIIRSQWVRRFVFLGVVWVCRGVLGVGRGVVPGSVSARAAARAARPATARPPPRPPPAAPRLYHACSAAVPANERDTRYAERGADARIVKRDI